MLQIVLLVKAQMNVRVNAVLFGGELLQKASRRCGRCNSVGSFCLQPPPARNQDERLKETAYGDDTGCHKRAPAGLSYSEGLPESREYQSCEKQFPDEVARCRNACINFQVRALYTLCHLSPEQTDHESQR